MPKPGQGPPEGSDCSHTIATNLQLWPEPFPEPLQSARRLFLLGGCHQELGNHLQAIGFFVQGIATAPSLATVFRIRLLRSYLAMGEFEQALALLGKVLSGTPREEVVAAARGTLTDWVAQPHADGDLARYRVLSTFLVAIEPTKEEIELIQSLREIASRLGDSPLIDKLDILLWMLPPTRKAAETWAKVPRAMKKKRIKIAEGAWLIHIRHLYRLQHYKQIVQELEDPTLQFTDPVEAGTLGRYYFLSMLRLKQYAKAARQLAAPAVRKRFAMGDQEALQQSINIDLRQRNVSAVLEKLKQWQADGYPTDPLPEIYLKLMRHYERGKNLKALLYWGERMVKEFPDHRLAELGFWLPIWNLYNRKKYPQAGEWGDRAIASTLPFDPEARARFFYWRARIHQAQGNQEAAKETLRALNQLWPTSFYGLILGLQGPNGPTAPRFPPLLRPTQPVSPPKNLKAIHSTPSLSQALFLLVVGEEELAVGQIGRLIGEPMPEGLLEELGQVFFFFDRYRLQFRLTANYYYTSLKRQPVTDSALWRYAFPRAFWPEVEKETRGQEVSPFFVLAIMREESHYDHKAGSITGARGLMQLMPATAKNVARRHRLPFQESDLERPEVNISLGTRYLKRVLKRFDWNPYYAAAAYNAGPNAVRRWKKEFGHLPTDEFIETIPYDETRAYVKRVMSSFLIYSRLYSAPPQVPGKPLQ